MTAPVGVLVMAYGTASGPDDIERYYTDIRGGRAPSPEHLAELRERYAAIGNVFPLLDTTRRQAEGLVDRLNEDAATFRAFLGMKHSPPFIEEAVAEMRDEGVERAVGIVMAPHWSGMSVETYVERVRAADRRADGPGVLVRPRVRRAPLVRAVPRRRVSRVPWRRCRRPSARRRTSCSRRTPCRRAWWTTGRSDARPVTATTRAAIGPGSRRRRISSPMTLGLESYGIAWQSAGRTADPWWGPPVEESILEAAAMGHPPWSCAPPASWPTTSRSSTTSTSRRRSIAEGAGIRFARTEMPNADPVFLDVLSDVLRDHLAGVAAP